MRRIYTGIVSVGVENEERVRERYSASKKIRPADAVSGLLFRHFFPL